MLIFTDGSHPERQEEGLKPRIGGILISGWDIDPIYFAKDVEKEMTREWITRENQIVMIELLATVVAVETFKNEIKNKKTILLVDSEPCEGALVKGYSTRSDMSLLTGKFWDIVAEIDCLMYIDRVSTDANPADIPSRADRTNEIHKLGWKEREASINAVIEGPG